MKKTLLVLALVLLANPEIFARPQYSILQGFGTKCQSCHIAPNVGMQRTSSGWMSRKDISLINPESIGLNPVFDAIGNSNGVLDDKITFGLDFRYQTARWSKTKNNIMTRENPFDPTITDTMEYSDPYATERDYMLMIFTPYLTINPIEGVTLEASYNLAYDIEDKKRYPGQTPFAASVIIQPWQNLPSLRIGMIQPMVGTDWDDHTMMTRNVVTKTATPPSVPCDYYELGAQLDYQAIDWLGVTLGLYDSKNISEMSGGLVPDNTMSGLAKVTLHPPDFGTGITSYCGFTHFVNSQFKTDNGIYFGNRFMTATSFFLHFGMGDRFAVMTEWLRTEYSNMRTTSNVSLELDYMIMEPIIGYARIEQGNTDMIVSNTNYTGNKYTLGAKIFLLPYIALIPEYKIYDREHVDGFNSQFACQLHIFY